MSGDSFPRRRKHQYVSGTSSNSLASLHSQPASLYAVLPQAQSVVETGIPAGEEGSRTAKVFDSDLVPKGSEMPGRERTQEFNAFATSLQMKMDMPDGVARLNSRPYHAKAEVGEFSQLARKIGHDLSQTFFKLEKLTMIAKKRTLFDDQMIEVDELTAIIKQDIALLNTQIASLQKVIQRNISRTAANQTQHSKSVVVSFQSRLASMSSEFRSVLEMRTENMKHQRLRREKYSSTEPVPSSLPASASEGRLGSILLRGDLNSDAGENQYVLNMEELDRQVQQQQVQLLDHQDSYLRARAETMSNIETTIVELGQIFAQLGRMVQEQGELVQRIDSNVEETTFHVQSAHLELVKYFRSISRNRWLAIKVFAVLIAFFVFFVVVMV
uniref:t-SNARE coiled-coil homology domain-containing protein n=1 Tax=Trichuris muris TaxID=70415 RepID=A0A5S6R0Y9_TRIMR